jgi:hypothetical protein
MINRQYIYILKPIMNKITFLAVGAAAAALSSCGGKADSGKTPVCYPTMIIDR